MALLNAASSSPGPCGSLCVLDFCNSGGAAVELATAAGARFGSVMR